MPQQARHRRDTDDEENGTNRKQEAEKAQEQFHRGTNLIQSISVEPDSSSALRGPPAGSRQNRTQQISAFAPPLWPECDSNGAHPLARSVLLTSSLGFLFKLRQIGRASCRERV